MNASMAVRTKGDHELDVTEPPDNYHVCSCDQAGEFLDLIEQSEEYTNAGSASTLIPTLGASAISFGGAELSVCRRDTTITGAG